jgi:hypothetical protein
MEDIKLVYSFGKIFFIQNPLDNFNRILQNIELFEKFDLEYHRNIIYTKILIDFFKYFPIKYSENIINYIKSFENSFDLNDNVIKIKYIDDFIFNKKDEMEEIINILNKHFKTDFIIRSYQNEIFILKFEKKVWLCLY